MKVFIKWVIIIDKSVEKCLICEDGYYLSDD